MTTTIETNINLISVVAINKMWAVFQIPDTTQGKVDKSILQYTAEKFIKKQMSKTGKKDRKIFKISLQYFEVVTLERYLRNFLHCWPTDSLEHSLIEQYKNQLHQLT